jgi:ribosomal protein S18 acetylase RimI-like enzyme
VVLGAIIAPGTGFVLQVAVRREKQGHGLGTDLLRGLAAAFRDAGLRDVALGVTRGNPAEGLYARLGFEVLREVNAYVWEA